VTLIWSVFALSAASAFVSASTDDSKRQKTIAIFIGAQTREGFTDVDRGILDSIKDVHHHFRGASEFTVVSTAEAADMVLLVVGRRTVGDSGSIGVPIGTTTIMVPVKRRVIDTVLRIGTYEKAITSEAEDHDAWKASAKAVVKDVRAWVAANREELARRR
jgi:hypothetical protein